MFHISPSDNQARVCKAPEGACPFGGTHYLTQQEAAFHAGENQPLTAAEQVLSRRISFILRHHPETAGLTPDEAGNVPVQPLLEAVDADLATLQRVVYLDNKKRYFFSDNERQVRAAQGHSFPVKLPVEEATPPAELFHGTKEAFWQAISSEGLRPMSRQYVHLSASLDTATQVAGRRKGDSIMLAVDTAKAMQAGVKFLKASNGVWLAKSVPAESISRHT